MPNNDTREQNNSVNQFEYTESIVSSKTPVLFSTSHGIHLRIESKYSRSSKYKLHFCDLERWQCSVNKVNLIGLTSAVDNMKCDKHNVKQKTKVQFVSESAGSSSASNVSKLTEST